MNRRKLTAAVSIALLSTAAANAAVQTFDAGDDLTIGANYDAGTGGTPDNTTDILIGSGYPLGPATFQLGTGETATSLAIQSFNATNEFDLVIGNNSSSATASNATLTLGNPAGQANAAAGAAAGDLIYVGGTGNVTFQGANLRNGQATGNGTMSIALAQSGNLNVANAAATLSINSNISGAFSLTKTGAGVLALSGANAFSGGLTIKEGTVSMKTNSGVLGTGTLVLGDTSGSANATLLFDPASTGVSINPSNPIVVQAGTTGTLRIGTTSSFGPSTISGNITLNNNLTLTMNRSADRTLTLSGVITGDGTITTGSINNSNKPGIAITGDNAATFTGNIVVAQGILGFNSGSLGQNSTGGTITFNNSLGSGNPGLAWLGENTDDLSGRFQPLTGSVSAQLDTRDNNVVFAAANGLSGPSTTTFIKQNGSGSGGVPSVGTLTLAAPNANFFGTFTTAANGATILAHTDALRNATVNITANNTQSQGGLMFSSDVSGHAFTIGNLAGAGGLWLLDDAENPVSLTLGKENNTVYSGMITGPGSITKTGTGTLTLSGENTFTGPTTVLGGGITLNNAGRLASTSSYSITNGTLFVNNESTLTANRLAEVDLILRGGTYMQAGRNAAASSTAETLGDLILDGGLNFVTLTQTVQTGATNRLTVNSLIRNNNAIAQIRGANGLGQLAAGEDGATFISVTNAPTTHLIGGNGTYASGSDTNIAIIPYLIGDLNPSGQTGTTLVGYDTDNNSYRTLKHSEFGTFDDADSTTNVRISGNATAIAAPAGTYNSLLINESGTPGVVTVTADGVITLNSGVLMFSKSSGNARNILFTGGQLLFPAANVPGVSRTEGIISVVTGANVQLDTRLSGVGGMTFTTVTNGSASSITLNNADNDWTGTTTIHGNVRVNADSRLGNSTEINVSSGSVLTLNGNTSIDDSAHLMLAEGATLNLAFADGLLETVDRLTLGSIVFNFPTTFNAANNWGGFGNESGFFAGSTGGLTVVPEPASLSVVALGMLTLLKRRRRTQ